ncbi:MAG TPA: DinB family protein [Chloroflexia bacterium]|nr:DinB family protein [Chloroflexia bacterium]
MEATSAEIERFLKLLEETPRRIASASIGLESALMHLKADKKAWSANDVLAHLRSCADVWGESIQEMLAKVNPTLPHLSPRQWIKKTEYPGLAFRESFQAFANQRNELLSTLRDLRFEDWSRSAMFQGRKHTVFSQARRMAKHENEHCEQIEALLKSGGPGTTIVR